MAGEEDDVGRVVAGSWVRDRAEEVDAPGDRGGRSLQFVAQGAVTGDDEVHVVEARDRGECELGVLLLREGTEERDDRSVGGESECPAGFGAIDGRGGRWSSMSTARGIAVISSRSMW